MHLLVDGMTCIPQAGWLHPELARHLPALRRMAGRMVDSGCELLLTDGDAEEGAAASWLLQQAGTQGCWQLPFLHPDYCDKLVVEAEAMAKTVGFTPNPDEQEDYQIPELVLQHVCPTLYTGLSVLKQQVIDTYTMLLFGSKATDIRSIQFARYEPNGVAHGNWHRDAESDITAVVSLQPHMFEGGGTDIRTNAFFSFHVPKLPQGYCLLFHGKARLHRGHAVTSGHRDLLVFWSEYSEDD